MRQGILYADAAGGALPPEAAPEAAAVETALPPAPPALETFAEDDEDAFDLDLNP